MISFASSHGGQLLVAVKAALGRRFGAAVSEVDHQDLWQRSTLAAALTSGSVHELERAGAAVERYLASRFPEGLRIERRLVSFADLA